MRIAALSLLAAGIALVGCVSPQSQADLHEARCRRLRARLERQPDNAKLQNYVATRCEQGQTGQTPAYAEPPSARCRKIQHLLARHPDNARYQSFAARYCPQNMNATATSASPTPELSGQSPAAPTAEPAPAVAAPAAPETLRALTPKEKKLINEQLLP